MVFEVPASKKSKDQNKFAYKVEGKEFKVALAKYLTGHQMEALLNGRLSVLYDAFGAATSAPGKAVRSLDMDQFGELVEAWVADSGVSVGELPAS
jgi:hypothetical protein